MTPDAALARSIASKLAGVPPALARRFETGSRHHVFDVTFTHHAPLVVRIGDRSAHAEMAGAVTLSQLLCPLGVPLPQLLAFDLEAALPWLALERLPGRDLGAVMPGLSDRQLDGIAAGVARAQAITAATGASVRYGYAVQPKAAPFALVGRAGRQPRLLTATDRRRRPVRSKPCRHGGGRTDGIAGGGRRRPGHPVPARHDDEERHRRARRQPVRHRRCR